MKKVLGAIAAAMVFGVGCAHNREQTPQASTESVGQAQTGGSGAMQNLSCEVVSPSTAGTGGSAMTGSTSSKTPVIDSGCEDTATGGSSSVGSAIEDQSLGAPQDLATQDAAPAEMNTGAAGSTASQDTALEDTRPSVDTSPSAAEPPVPEDTFEETDMGGVGGGGG